MNTYIDPMVPNRDYCEGVPDGSDRQIADKKQEVTIVILTETIVHPGAVMIHRKYTPIAHHAVGGASGFNLFTLRTFFLPNLLQVCGCLVPVFHHGFYLARDSFKPL